MTGIMQHLMHFIRQGRTSHKALIVAAAIALLSALLGASIFAHSDSKREECSLCGMWIDMYMKTRHVVTLDDGTSETFCSIACASKYIKSKGISVAGVMAADFNSRDLIDAYSAFYLSGSDVPGVMAYTSRLAFSTSEAAEAFQKTHGGRIIDFKEALRELDE